MPEGRRLDRLLVDTGLARSRGQAQDLIRSGRVKVAGNVVDKASYAVPRGADVAVDRPEHDWVGRGAEKLRHAFAEWALEGLTATGRRCLDVGASTGGFTQVLLRAGAAHVTALDVGHGQLSAEIAADDRVTDLPGRNIRDVGPEDLGPAFDLVVADLSFISLTTVLPVMGALLASHGDMVVLVKPQFEVGRERLGKGGLVRRSRDRAAAIQGVVDTAEQAGLGVKGLTRSVVTGTHGNVEYLLWLTAAGSGMMNPPEITVRIEQLTGEETA